MMLSSIRKARVALLAVPLTCALGVAYAGGMEAPSGSMEGYHVVGTLAHGLGYFDFSDVSADNNWEWISPSVSSTMGLTYNKSGVKWGSHAWDLKGAFQLGYSESNVEHDGFGGAVRPDYSFSVASSDFGTFAFSSMVKTTLGEGYVQGKLYSDNRWAEYTWTGGVGADVFPSMLMLNHYQDTGVKGGSYTTPSLFSLGKGDGLKLFVSARDKNRASYGASFEVAADNGMAMTLAAGFSPKADFEADTLAISGALYDSNNDDYDKAVRYFEQPWSLPQSHARAQDYLISFKAPDSMGMGMALTGFWNKKDPKADEINSWNDTPHAYGVSGSLQKDFGPGMTTLRVGYQKDSVRGLGSLDALTPIKVNSEQTRWSVSLNQPVMKNLNALFGWNRYTINNYPITALAAGGAIVNRPAPGDTINGNSMFFVGMEYMIAT